MILSKDTELKILGCLYRNQQFSDSVAEHLDYKLFSMAMDKNIAKIAIDQFKSHRTLATQYVFGHELKKLLDRKIIGEDEKDPYVARFIELYQIDISDWEYVLEQQLIPFIKQRLYKVLVEDMISKLLPQEKFDEIERRFDYIKNIGVMEQAPTMETFTVEAITKRYEDRVREIEMIGKGVARIPYGIPKLDEISGGGINTEKDRLVVFAAPPKVGKSMSLLHFANEAAKKGFNVAYFTYETAISVLQDRLDASNSGVRINDILSRVNDVRDFTLDEAPSRGEIFFAKYATGTATARTVKNDVLRIESRFNKKINLVIVDYLDIGRKDERIKDDNDRDTENWHSYRRCAEELGIPLLSATQISSKAVGKSVITSDKVLGSTGKLASVDALFIVSGTDQDIANGKIYITSAVCRNIRKTTFSIKAAYELGRFFVKMDQDEIY